MHVKLDDIYRGIAENDERRFDTYDLVRSQPKGKNKKVIGVMKDKKVEKPWKNLLD